MLVAIKFRDLVNLGILYRSWTHRPGGGTPRSRIRNVYPLYGSIPATCFRGRNRRRRANIDELLRDSDGEPKVNPALVAHPRLVRVPHLGSATRHTRAAMTNLAARNVVLAGDPPITPVPR